MLNTFKIQNKHPTNTHPEFFFVLHCKVISFIHITINAATCCVSDIFSLANLVLSKYACIARSDNIYDPTIQHSSLWCLHLDTRLNVQLCIHLLKTRLASAKTCLILNLVAIKESPFLPHKPVIYFDTRQLRIRSVTASDVACKLHTPNPVPE